MCHLLLNKQNGERGEGEWGETLSFLAALVTIRYGLQLMWQEVEISGKITINITAHFPKTYGKQLRFVESIQS